MNSVWIVGGQGFIGSHLKNKLVADGITVCVIGRKKYELFNCDGIRSEFSCGNIPIETLQQIKQQLGHPSIIYQLAGASSVGQAIAFPLESFRDTVEYTAVILEWMRLESPHSRLLISSSAAVYGNTFYDRIDETCTGIPYSPYGYYKLMAEDVCRTYASMYGLKIVIARLFSVYGAGLKKQFLWDISNKLISNPLSIELSGTGEELRDWINVMDVAYRLPVLANLADTNAPVFNIGTGKGTNVGEIARLIKEYLGVKTDITFTSIKRTGDPFSLIANVEKINNVQPIPYKPVEIGIEEYIQWFRNSHEMSPE